MVIRTRRKGSVEGIIGSMEGSCPHCNYDSARGDQCENCGKLLNPTEMILNRLEENRFSNIYKNQDVGYEGTM